MRKPAIGGRTVPVFDPRRNIHHIPGGKLTRRLIPLLIPAASAGYQQDLSAFMVDMPVVSTAGLKHHIADIDAFRGEHIQVAGALKILRISLVFLPLGEDTVTVKLLVHGVSTVQFRSSS